MALSWTCGKAHKERIPYSECALIYRIHRNGRAIEEQCVRSQIPYRVIGGPRFYDRAEIRDCMAYLRLLQNPGDDVSVQRIANRPTRGIGATSMERLTGWANRVRQTLMQAMAFGANEMALSAERVGLTARARAAVGHFDGLIAELSGEMPLAELLDEMLEMNGAVWVMRSAVTRRVRTGGRTSRSCGRCAPTKTGKGWSPPKERWPACWRTSRCSTRRLRKTTREPSRCTRPRGWI